MNLRKTEDSVFKELYIKKKSADKLWDQALLEALHGNIDQAQLYRCMDLCNKTEQAIIDFEKSKKKIIEGKSGYSDEEFQSKFIDPYKHSKH